MIRHGAMARLAALMGCVALSACGGGGDGAVAQAADGLTSAPAPASTPDMTATAVRVPYAGIATRAVALAIDAALAQAIFFAGGAVFALIASLVSDNIKFNALQAVVATR